MQYTFPDGPLSLQKKFYVVEDTNHKHIISSIEKRGHPYLVIKEANGHDAIINLSASFALSDVYKITALAVTQSQQPLIHLAFAVAKLTARQKIYRGHHGAEISPSLQREELDPKQSLSHRGLYAGPF